MQSLLLLGTLVIIAAVQVYGVSRFGCKFEDANYRVEHEFPLFTPQKIYGLSFGQDTNKLKQFYEAVERSRSDAYKENVVDEITPFNKLYEAMKSKGLKYGDQDTVEKFAHDFALPINSTNTYLHLILKVVEKVKIAMPEYKDQIEENFFFAGMAIGVSTDSVALLQSGTPRKDVPGVDPAHFVGVIKVQTGMFGAKPSYIIIDTEYATTPTPILGRNEETYDPSAPYFPEHKYTSLGDPVEYKFLDKDSKYLKATIRDANNPDTLSENIIFMEAPFCSFVEADNYQILGSLIKVMVKLTPEGKMAAGVAALYPGYVPQGQGIWTPNPREKLYYNNQPDVKNTIVPDITNLEGSTDAVKDILSAMNVNSDQQEKLMDTIKENSQLNADIITQRSEDYVKWYNNLETTGRRTSILDRVAETTRAKQAVKNNNPVKDLQATKEGLAAGNADDGDAATAAAN